MPPVCIAGKCGPYELPHRRPFHSFFDVYDGRLVSFVAGKPVCPSGAATQSSTSVQNPDGTWTTVATGAWKCLVRRAYGSGPN